MRKYFPFLCELFGKFNFDCTIKNMKGKDNEVFKRFLTDGDGTFCENLLG
jgi:hypothetical protein